MKKLNFKNQTKLSVVTFVVIVAAAIALCVLTTGTANAASNENLEKCNRTVSECQEEFIYNDSKKSIGKSYYWENCSPYTIDKDSVISETRLFDESIICDWLNTDLLLPYSHNTYASELDEAKYEYSEENFIDKVYICYSWMTGLCVVADYHSGTWFDDVGAEYTVKAVNNSGVVVGTAIVKESENIHNVEPVGVTKKKWKYTRDPNNPDANINDKFAEDEKSWVNFFQEGGFVTISEIHVLD